MIGTIAAGREGGVALVVAWNELNDTEAIAAACAEASGLDRHAFLSRYPGFEPSTKFFAVVNGKHVDSKPFLAAVYARHFPDRAGLTRGDLRGGAETTRALTGLGISWVDLSLGDGLTDGWRTPIGSLSTKEELAALYGGSTQGGIQASRRTPNILLYTDPLVGKDNGYTHDGWSEDRSVFMYTGEGRTGAQTLTRGNKNILDHQTDGRALRLFVSAGLKHGAKAILRQYLGEFRIDTRTPYLVDESLDVENNNRTVYVFRLKPIGSTLHLPGDVTPDYQAGKTAEPARIVNLDTHEKDVYETPGVEPVIAEKREQALVEAFTAVLTARGHDCKAFYIPLPFSRRGLKTDVFDTTAGVLYEAKSSANRFDVRLALGQILDYRRFLEGNFKRLAVLLPAEPAEDMITLLNAFDIDVVWRASAGGVFIKVSDGVRENF